METHLSDAVQLGLLTARKKSLRKSKKLRVETSDGYFRILELWDTGFSVLAKDAHALRGFVNVFEGSTHLFRCLVVASEEVDDFVMFEFKRSTAVSSEAPRDFASDTPAPVALLDSPAV